ncbi:ubiquitin carboxyl-terminal hydrolase isozyme L3-like [Styela clava]|uniref:ubiquitin carboxyl-terminal hydrolase isozyme L3-like n=1 Tax=Styela clava TaxID=7725 RepID=UPI001939A1F3|nr:ubiquitin carboxyl-terminal hydrolase isozyme L3-like [Styela clava]
MSKLRWKPLEANPDVMNSYSKEIGLSPDWEFVDVYGLDRDSLLYLPQPCCAFILLFPITEKYEIFCKEEKEKQKDLQNSSVSVYFMKQTIGNACGTIGLLHSFGNNQYREDFVKEGSILKSLLDASSNLSPEEKGKLLESNEDMCKAHQKSASEGQSREISADEEVNLHFVAIVRVGTTIYEFDGRKPFPIDHGKCNEESDFVHCAAGVCLKFMARDPDEARFTIVALCAKQT